MYRLMCDGDCFFTVWYSAVHYMVHCRFLKMMLEICGCHCTGGLVLDWDGV